MAPAREEPAPLSPEEKAQIDKAISWGVAYLRKIQLAGGLWPDGAHLGLHKGAGGADWPAAYAALPALTLLECGVPATDPGVQRAARFVRLAAPTLHRTYEISLAVLFLDRLGAPEDRGLIQTLLLRLAAGQNITGGWGYTCPLLDRSREQKLLQLMRERQDAAQDRPAGGEQANQKEAPAERRQQDAARANGKAEQQRAVKKSDGPRGTGAVSKPIPLQGDNSNTQFAILALWVARRYDLPLGPTVARIAQRFRSTQQRASGWGYGQTMQGYVTPARLTSGSMTCVGLMGLALGRAWDPPARLRAAAEAVRAEDPGLALGLRALGGWMNDPRDKFRNTCIVNLYFLWSVERVGVLCGLRTIGGWDWYRWGGSLLLAAQRPDGSWYVRGPAAVRDHGLDGGRGFVTPTIDTCMALLFLRRADLLPGLREELRKRVIVTDPGPYRKADTAKKGGKAPTPEPVSQPAPTPPADPLAVTFKEVKVGIPTERRVVLRCATAFKITGIDGTDDYLQAKADSESRTEPVLTVTLRPSDPGEVTRTLRLRTDLPDRPEIEVTVKARAVP